MVAYWSGDGDFSATLYIIKPVLQINISGQLHTLVILITRNVLIVYAIPILNLVVKRKTSTPQMETEPDHPGC